MKNTLMRCCAVLLIVVVFFISCATATEIPPNASSEQINQINAQNLVAIAKNSSTQTGITLASILLGFVSAVYSLGSLSGYYSGY